MARNLNSRIDGGITSSNGMANVGSTYRNMGHLKPVTPVPGTTPKFEGRSKASIALGVTSGSRAKNRSGIK
jgi:hypothetical protein